MLQHCNVLQVWRQTTHYFNTYDGQGEMEFKEEETTALEPPIDDEDCEACVI